MRNDRKCEGRTWGLFEDIKHTHTQNLAIRENIPKYTYYHYMRTKDCFKDLLFFEDKSVAYKFIVKARVLASSSQEFERHLEHAD